MAVLAVIDARNSGRESVAVVTSPGDRPAAELLAEWEAIASGSYRLEKYSFAIVNVGHVLERLARAEQALTEAKADAWGEGWSAGFDDHLANSHPRYWTDNPYSAALRAKANRG